MTKIKYLLYGFTFLMCQTICQAQAKPILFTVVTNDQSNTALGKLFDSEIHSFFQSDVSVVEKYLSQCDLYDYNKCIQFVALYGRKYEGLAKILRSQFVFIFSIGNDEKGKNIDMRKIKVSLVIRDDIFSEIQISDLILFKDEIRPMLKSLMTNIIEKVIDNKIDPTRKDVLYLVINDDLYNRFANYRKICFEILKETEFQQYFFVLMKNKEGDYDILANLQGNVLYLIFENRTRSLTKGIFRNILTSDDIERAKIHRFCQTLIESHHDQKPRTFNYSAP